MRRLLGEILVESGLSAERLKKTLDLQKKRGGRIGTLLVRLNFVTEAEVLTALGAQLGSASIIVNDETISIDRLINKTVHFFRHESCGKCTPCREGTFWLSRVYARLQGGHGGPDDIAWKYPDEGITWGAQLKCVSCHANQ